MANKTSIINKKVEEIISIFDDYQSNYYIKERLNQLIDNYNSKINNILNQPFSLVIEDESIIEHNFLVQLDILKEESQKLMDEYNKYELFKKTLENFRSDINEETKRINSIFNYFEKFNYNNSDIKDVIYTYESSCKYNIEQINLRIKSLFKHDKEEGVIAIYQDRIPDDYNEVDYNPYDTFYEQFNNSLEKACENKGLSKELLKKDNLDLLLKYKKEAYVSYISSLKKQCEDKIYKIVDKYNESIIFDEFTYFLENVFYSDVIKESTFDNDIKKYLELLKKLSLIESLFDELDDNIKYNKNIINSCVVTDSKSIKDTLEEGKLKPINYKEFGISNAILHTGEVTDYADYYNATGWDYNNTGIKSAFTPKKDIGSNGFRPCIKVDNIASLPGCKYIGKESIAGEEVDIYEYGKYPQKRNWINKGSEFKWLNRKFTNNGWFNRYKEYKCLPKSLIDDEEYLVLPQQSDRAFKIEPIRWMYDKKTKTLISINSLSSYKSCTIKYPDERKIILPLSTLFGRNMLTPEMITINKEPYKSFIKEIEQLLNDTNLSDKNKELYNKWINKIKRDCISNYKYYMEEISLNLEQDNYYSKSYDEMLNNYNQNESINNIDISSQEEYINETIELKEILEYIKNIKKMLNILDGKEEGELTAFLNDIKKTFNLSIKAASLIDNFNEIINQFKNDLNKEIEHLDIIIDAGGSYETKTFEQLKQDLAFRLQPFLEKLNSITNESNKNVISKIEEETRKDIVTNISTETKKMISDILKYDLTNNTLNEVNKLKEELDNINNLPLNSSQKYYSIVELQKKLSRINSDIEIDKAKEDYKKGYHVSNI